MSTYKIKSGDNLTKIAKQYGVSVNDLAKANNITNTNYIVTGKSLKIPTATVPKATVPNATQQATKKTPKPTITSQNNYEMNKPNYQQSSDVSNAFDILSQLENNKPGDYNSNYQGQIQGVLDKINNREKFNYDFKADPIYQQYKDQYTKQADLAMRDAIGNTSALTGGYGSSYGTIAASQAHDSSMSQLNNVVPELYNMAYGMYRDEGNDLMNQLGMYQGLDQTDYSRYRDSYGDYLNELSYQANKANNMSNTEYSRHLDGLGSWERDRAYGYGKDQDALAQENYLRQFAYQKEMDALAQSNYMNEFAYKQSQDKLSQDNYLKELALKQAQSTQGLKGESTTTQLKGSTNSNVSNGDIIDFINNTHKTIMNMVNGKQNGESEGRKLIEDLYASGRISLEGVEILSGLLNEELKKKSKEPYKQEPRRKNEAVGGGGVDDRNSYK